MAMTTRLRTKKREEVRKEMIIVAESNFLPKSDFNGFYRIRWASFLNENIIKSIGNYPNLVHNKLMLSFK